MKVLIDSSAFISLLVPNQASHDAAREIYTELKDHHVMLYTSNLILSETFTWLLYKNSLRVAGGLKQMTDQAEKEGFLDIFWIDDLYSKEVWDYFVKFAEHKFSYTDAFSYLLVKKFRLDGIFTFDEGFKKVGLPAKP